MALTSSSLLSYLLVILFNLPLGYFSSYALDLVNSKKIVILLKLKKKCSELCAKGKEYQALLVNVPVT